MARSSRSRRGGKNTISIPGMSGVETRKLVAEGEYLVEVEEVTQKEGDKAPYLEWKFKIVDDDKFEDSVLYFNTSLSEQSLWNLKALLEALGADVPDEAEEIDPEDFKGMAMMVNVEHDSWEGRKRAKIVDFWEAEEEKEEKPAKGKRARGGKDEKEERGGRRRGGKEEKEERGGRGRRGKKEPELETYTASQINDMDQDELADVVKEADLDVDLDKLRTLRKMQNAVVDALEKAELLEKD